MASYVAKFRIPVLVSISLLSVVVLGLAAHVTSVTVKDLYGFYLDFTVWSIIAASFSLLTVPLMIVMGLVRKNAATSMIIVELAWLSIITVSWLSSGAKASETVILFGGGSGCSYYFSSDTYFSKNLCSEMYAVQALDYLNFVILFCYSLTLFCVSGAAASHGAPVWDKSVEDAFRSTTPSSTAQSPILERQQMRLPPPPNLDAENPFAWRPASASTMGWAGEPISGLHSPQHVVSTV